VQKAIAVEHRNSLMQVGNRVITNPLIAFHLHREGVIRSDVFIINYG
jgi:hypothetical protein